MPGQPLTAEAVTRALVELSLAQGTRLFDVVAVSGPQASELVRAEMEARLVRPLMDADRRNWGRRKSPCRTANGRSAVCRRDGGGGSGTAPS